MTVSESPQRAAYARFTRVVESSPHRQRVLWASSGMKDARPRPTFSVENLVGPHTSNTMALATLRAAADGLDLRAAADGLDLRAATADLGGATCARSPRRA